MQSWRRTAALKDHRGPGVPSRLSRVNSRKATPEPIVLATLHDWYRGEVGGEHLFLALAARATDSARSRQWRTLAALEAATRARLAAAITGLGHPLPEQPPDPDLAPRRLAE